MKIRAEYIWIDGTEPTREVRSKTKIMDKGDEPGIWGFDGSSTNQATGDNSDVVLIPVFVCPDPIRGGDDILVLCETLLTADLSPHPTNTRARAQAALDKYGDQEPWFGLEQEYTLINPGTGWPAGFPPNGFPAPQGPYYCGVGALKIHGRDLIEEHTKACIDAGLAISGTNAEVMPGQWEFQIGPADTGHRRRSPLDCSLPAVPSRRRSWRGGQHRSQAHEGRLEWCRYAHQLLHQGHARGLRRHRGRL